MSDWFATSEGCNCTTHIPSWPNPQTYYQLIRTQTSCPNGTFLTIPLAHMRLACLGRSSIYIHMHSIMIGLKYIHINCDTSHTLWYTTIYDWYINICLSLSLYICIYKYDIRVSLKGFSSFGPPLSCLPQNPCTSKNAFRSVVWVEVGDNLTSK